MTRKSTDIIARSLQVALYLYWGCKDKMVTIACPAQNITNGKNALLYGEKDASKCERCSEPNEDIYHVFWGCNQSKNFWVRLQRKLSLLQVLHRRKLS